MLPLGALLFAAPSAAVRFDINAESGGVVRFESKAPMETFDGKTQNVSGYVMFDPAGIGDSITVLVEVDMATLDTGISKRNQHMRDRHLETDRYPVARFAGASILSMNGHALPAGTTVTIRLEGELELHGVKRRLQLPVDVTLDASGRPNLHVTGQFTVKLGDFNISRPRFLFMKLSEEQTVTLELNAHAAATSE